MTSAEIIKKVKALILNANDYVSSSAPRTDGKYSILTALETFSSYDALYKEAREMISAAIREIDEKKTEGGTYGGLIQLFETKNTHTECMKVLDIAIQRNSIK